MDLFTAISEASEKIAEIQRKAEKVPPQYKEFTEITVLHLTNELAKQIGNEFAKQITKDYSLTKFKI
ncbi:hypothetical protein [Daejeonia sp. YH14]|uniref:hypothetical protein n=1 Tax=Daejeonia sp. YH14 TaxID=3439042 RepID=UPI003F49936C